MRSFYKKAAAAAVGAGSVAMASAAAVDVTAVTTDIAAQMTSIASVGGAVLLVFLGIKAFNWIRAAIK